MKFKDESGVVMRRGDYISIMRTMQMSNHFWDGHESNIKVNTDPERFWLTTGIVVYFIKSDGLCIIAERVLEVGHPHPGLSWNASIDLNSCFESENYEILGNKKDGYKLDLQTRRMLRLKMNEYIKQNSL